MTRLSGPLSTAMPEAKAHFQISDAQEHIVLRYAKANFVHSLMIAVERVLRDAAGN